MKKDTKLSLYPGMSFDGYRVLELLKTGGQAEVWKAEKVDVRKPIALKVLSRSKRKNPKAKRRLEIESKVPGLLGSFWGLVPVLAFGVSKKQGPYLVMEYLEGETLRQRLTSQKDKRFSVEEIGRIGVEICRILAAVHRKGVIHRDIKPSNIFLEKTPFGEQIKLLDFGVAYVPTLSERSEQYSKGEGTRRAMAPEQKSGEFVGPAADIYSVGILLYEMATGTSPIPPLYSKDEKVIPEKFPRMFTPALPEKLESIILHCLAFKSEERYSSCDELADALLSATGIEETFQIPQEEFLSPQNPSSLPKTSSKRKGKRLVLGLAFSVGVFSLSFVLYQNLSFDKVQPSPSSAISRTSEVHPKAPAPEQIQEIQGSPPVLSKKHAGFQKEEQVSTKAEPRKNLSRAYKKSPTKQDRDNLATKPLITPSNPPSNSSKSELEKNKKVREILEEPGPGAIPLELLPKDWSSEKDKE